MELACDLCRISGTILYVCPGVIPEIVKCGHCGETFRYRPTCWERIVAEDHGFEQSAYYLTPLWKPDPEPVIPPPPEDGGYEAMSTKRLLWILREERNDYEPYHDLDAVRRVLRTRPHIPKGMVEARKARANRERQPSRTHNYLHK